jgi:hypothetical protein
MTFESYDLRVAVLQGISTSASQNTGLSAPQVELLSRSLEFDTSKLKALAKIAFSIYVL